MAILTRPAPISGLNNIENVWNLMEKVVYRNKQCNGWKKLISALERCAKKFNKDTIMNLHKSIPGRLLKVIDVEGAEIQ